jgi:hypothetical protein
MADGVGNGSAGEGVGAETRAPGLVETLGHGLTAVVDEGVHPATLIATTPAMTANPWWRT